MTTTGPLSATRSVERAVQVIAQVCARESISLSECARQANLPLSTTSRLLRTLDMSGFVARHDDGSYGAGPRLIQLGALAWGRQNIVRLAEPALQRIVAATGESAYLAIPGPDDTAIYIAMAEGTHAVRHTSWVGRSIRRADLAVGRALAGDVGPEGYVAERDRGEPDVTAIVAPVRRPGGVAGALSLLGPTYRIDDARMSAYGQIVSGEARSLADQLGTVGAAVPQER